GPCNTYGALVGSVRSSGRECLYEQCSLHSALTIPSSVNVGTRPSIATRRSYSSGVSPCSATSAGVMTGSPGRDSTREVSGMRWLRLLRGWRGLGRWSTAASSVDARDHDWRAAFAGVLATGRTKHGVDDLAAVEHDEIVHAARPLAAVLVEEIRVTVRRPRRERRTQFRDDLRLRHAGIDGGRLRIRRACDRHPEEQSDEGSRVHEGGKSRRPRG